ncbi:RhoGAP domain containing protein [Entamoeba histolytica HM-1:IMSS-B]|uniref:RhoGAP domain containing protein n=4 Tax=Entamoeba histolytica TaxID=5759 RepID=C4M1X2_ENTH1|nr:RhoGAP domain containing protein [Entamoeba histolytica HM-1:IMSS]EAL49834.1 RhoGAP domain containing protein [Entamoeba histolytica HM-1:IMSS]EMH74451.1 RhoGAP domain containing protein [Entamoeba histolytica HM-1:IMSS-B]ENY63213.1 RhoGAP domain containing protein [Entamoeba histolytica HM-1:IMSS-A]GAT95244.1 rhogap domain containing protein [Entamoeba histolytica]|eukprot:XP_655219.1 RhoGAP domain containing protein [Entamoeba histolytica HM-1:IMSS]
MINTKRKYRKDKKKHITDQMQLFELLQLRCEEITKNLPKVIDSILQIQSHLHSISNTTPVGIHKNSMFQLINSSGSYQSLVADKLKTISSWYEKLSKELNSNLLVDDLSFSNNEEIKKIQDDKKINICHYSALTSFCSRVEQLFPSLENTSEFEYTATRLIKEFKEDCELNQIYTCKNLEEIIEDEYHPTEHVPVGINRIMTELYYSKNDKSTLFRLSSDTEQINKYYESIRSLDYKNLDNTTLSSLLKKFIRNLKSPIWPEEFLQPLVSCMDSQNKMSLIASIHGMINKLPPSNKAFLKKLVFLCNEVIHSKDSKMTAQSIAVCLAPGLMRKNDMTCASIAAITPTLNNALALIIENQSTFFGKSSPYTENFTDIFGEYSNVFDAGVSDEIFEDITLKVDPRTLRGAFRKRKPTLLPNSTNTLVAIQPIKRSNSADPLE